MRETGLELEGEQIAVYFQASSSTINPLYIAVLRPPILPEIILAWPICCTNCCRVPAANFYKYTALHPENQEGKAQKLARPTEAFSVERAIVFRRLRFKTLYGI